MNIKRVQNSSFSTIDFSNLEFGKVFSDHMLVCDFDGTSWGEFSIVPLAPLSLHPATSTLHYGQAIFEGLKAYRAANNRLNVFRLKDNIARFNISAARMQMPTLDADKAFEAIKLFVQVDKDFVPTKEQGSLYIRPFMISTDDTLKAVASRTYRFMVIACAVGFYYNKPLKIYVEHNHRRAARGGVGFAKAAGNYAASFYPAELAKQAGYDQILWTDITNDNTLEELGSANFFYVKQGVLHTPEIHDSILKGITRDTIITLAKARGMRVVEGSTPSAQFKADLEAGLLECMFATGTAAAITYINTVTIHESDFTISSDSYEPIGLLKNDLDAAKFLESENHTEWNVIVE